MDVPMKEYDPRNTVLILCEFCGNIATSRCSRCYIASYCSVEHQLLHWPFHEKFCKKSQPSTSVSMNPCNISNQAFISFPPGSSNDTFMGGISADASQGMFVNTFGTSSDAFNMNMNLPNVTTDSFASLENWCPNTMVCSGNEGINPAILSSTVTSPDSSSIMPQNADLPLEDSLFSSLVNDESMLYLPQDINFWDLFNTCTQESVNFGTTFGGNTLSQATNPEIHASFVPDASSVGPDPDSKLGKLSISEISTVIVRDMKQIGICVIDNFAGTNFGNSVLQEVKNMYVEGKFREGQLISTNVSDASVRSDKVIWVNGQESGCKHIGILMRKLDSVIAACNTVPDRGIFSNYKLHTRTKAMVACYPGDGTHYKRHIDNPHQDGRCITCIYYLNKNWNTKVDGGLLRMYPTESDKPANIHPYFDRVIFFWSDKRNPHEVLPSFATRFAITLWYFDHDERKRALEKLASNRALMKSRNQ